VPNVIQVRAAALVLNSMELSCWKLHRHPSRSPRCGPGTRPNLPNRHVHQRNRSLERTLGSIIQTDDRPFGHLIVGHASYSARICFVPCRLQALKILHHVWSSGPQLHRSRLTTRIVMNIHEMRDLTSCATAANECGPISLLCSISPATWLLFSTAKDCAGPLMSSEKNRT
jgi:hypothetical protein